MRLLRPLAGAAAAIAVVMGGLVVISYNSTPEDPLWSVKSVVFAEQADSTVAQIDTTSKLQEGGEPSVVRRCTDAARALLDGTLEPQFCGHRRCSASRTRPVAGPFAAGVAGHDGAARGTSDGCGPGLAPLSVPSQATLVSDGSGGDGCTGIHRGSEHAESGNDDTGQPARHHESEDPTTTDVTPTVLDNQNQPTATAASGSSPENGDRMSVPSGGS